MTSFGLGAVLILAVDAIPTRSVGAQSASASGEWRHYNGDLAGTKYSALDQINRDTVKDLRIAWRWKSDNFGPRPEFNYEATPLMVRGVLYVTAGFRRSVVAIDAATGETLWMHRIDEGERAAKSPVRQQSGRGVSYWTDGRGDERILYVTLGYRLVALDARTGRPVPTFGKDGMIDLTEGMDRAVPPVAGEIGWGSPPLIVNDVVVVGSSHAQALPPPAVPTTGHVRGFDVRTGKRIWIFHTIPRPGEFGNETWENDSWVTTGNVGVWAPMAADEALGYVYLPLETATNDLYGGQRPGHGLFGESLVCLDARTGKRIWHYQLVHHGIWDYDIPTTPNLIDVTVSGRRVKAVAQVTKQAFVYVFDRITGEPIWPIAERPVPPSDVPGEKASPTQPFPTRPLPFDQQGVSLENLIDFTPELKAEAVKIASQYRIGPLFTPAIVAGSNGLKGTLMMPAGVGGANWQGGAVDPETGMLYVGSLSHTSVISLTPDPKRPDRPYVSGIGGFVDPRLPGCGAFGPQGLPLIKPPWGRVTAIDLNTGDHAWTVPNGDTPDCVKNHPALKGLTIPKTGKPERPGLLLTKALLFVGEGAALRGSTVGGGGGRKLRAYDKRTGDTVWEFDLPANQTGNPMTYMVNSKQYVVIPTGSATQPGELVALSLP
jgi:quinoprotein glucose dehydrogenase